MDREGSSLPHGGIHASVAKTGASAGLTLSEAIARYRAISPNPAKIRLSEKKKVRVRCPSCGIAFETFPAPREGRVSLLIQYDSSRTPGLYKEVAGASTWGLLVACHPANIPEMVTSQ